MKRKSPTSLPPRQFFGTHAEAIEKGHASERKPDNLDLPTLLDLVARGEEPIPLRTITPKQMWSAVEEWWPICEVRKAAEEGDHESCKRLLHYFLAKLGVFLPKGVLMPFRWQKGRRQETRPIYEAWVAAGQPQPIWRVLDDLARRFYPQEFAPTKPNSKKRKRLRDRVRATLVRQAAAQSATKPSRVS